MQIMNDFKPVETKSNNQVLLGTAFAQGGSSKKQTKGRLTDAQWNAFSPAEKTKLIEKQKRKRQAKRLQQVSQQNHQK